MISLDLNKNQQRKHIQNIRDALSTYDLLRKSNEIVKRLKNIHELDQSTVVACYISFDNEVYTHGFIREYIKQKEILIPFIDRQTKKLHLSHLKNWKELQSGCYGILEPEKSSLRIKKPSIVDVFLIPGIVFDRYGNRIGYGCGYFDKLLSKLDATKIGLAFDFQVLERIPHEPHDIKMDYILTETQTIRLPH
jgi:5-formyltetrahydrofolate cyclo-ligase